MSASAADWAAGLPLMAGPYFVGLYQPSPETVGYWEGVKQGELRLKHCPRCDRVYHPKRIICTECGTDGLDWRAAAGEGEVYSFSELHRAAAPEFVASLPFTVGIVALREGVQLFTRFISDPGPIAIGAPARVAFRELEQGHLLPVFLVGAP
jgi:hypothetical protein